MPASRALRIGSIILFTGFLLQARAAAAPSYTPIDPVMADRTIVLTGKSLTVDQVIAIARYGARVQLSAEAKQRTADAYGLLMEAATENVPVYWFNRGDGPDRHVVIFSGDPDSPQNKALLAKKQLDALRRGAVQGYGPEISDEELVRAIMAIRVNTMTYEAASPQLTQMLQDLLNKRVTPVVQSRGTVGEGDLATMGNIGATMVGSGDAYYRGVRMSAAQALERAGLKPLQPGAADDGALTSTNAYAAAQAALLVNDARLTLEWADLIYAMDLLGMNSTVTPLAAPVQANRPFKWLNFDAHRVLNILKGSYLFDRDPLRIIQDPESLRASPQRQGSAWEAWGRLRDDLQLQMNSSDHNPAVLVGASPTDSWEMSTPAMMQYYVKGGPHSHGQHGYVLSTANWDPYPLANSVEALTIALANMDVAVAQRIDRFTNTFFTVVSPADVLGRTPADPPMQAFTPYLRADLWQQIADSMNPISPNGDAIVAGVEDLQGHTRLKLARARSAVETTMQLLGLDLLNASYWMDLRKRQDATRSFGTAPATALTALRKAVPWDSADRPAGPLGEAAYAFMREHPAAEFYPAETPPQAPSL
ncbi:MAG TPA: aromatic amino acid ammonia-lyase [Candidatus Rubrimentiphilum sp.]|nr:aromatic amino acid ammonia-lyase [Candidatus Rubrimentiphilum sp.]